jgi:hypothetical protein
VFDIEDQLSAILSEQIAKEIDKDILRGLGYEPELNRRRMNKINKIKSKSNIPLGLVNFIFYWYIIK